MQKQNLLKRQTEEEDDVTPKIKKQKVPKNLSQFMKNTYAGKCLLAAKGKNGKQEEEVEDPKEKEKYTQRMMDTVEVDDDKDSPKKTVTKRRMDPVKGVIKSKVGFMKVAGEDDEVKEVEEEPKTKKRSEKKKSPKEYLRQIIKSKVGNRCSKANVNSFKTKYLTLKKKVSALQLEVGVKSNFLLMIKNNLQDRNNKNAAPTAGKYMVFAEGDIKEQLFGDGIKYNDNDMYVMANNFDYTEEIVAKEESEEDINDGGAISDKEESGPIRSRVEPINKPKKKLLQRKACEHVRICACAHVRILSEEEEEAEKEEEGSSDIEEVESCQGPSVLPNTFLRERDNSENLNGTFDE